MALPTASDNVFPKVILEEGSAPATPASGQVKVYAKTDGLVYSKDDAGVETGPFGGSGVADIVDIPTAETDTALVLAPDGAGGVEFRAETGGGGASGYDLDTYSIDGTYGDDFTGAALAGIWTRRNFTSGAETYQVGPVGTYTRIAMTGRAAGDGYFQTAPAGDWTFAMSFIPRGWSVFGWSLAVVNSVGTGLGVCFGDAGSGTPSLLTAGITTYSTYSAVFQTGSASLSHALSFYNEHKQWMYLRKSGTNYYAATSKDGEVWGPENPAFSSGITVDRVGMIVHPQQGVTTAAVVDVDSFNKIA